jgi:hypothetical protein
MAETTVLTTPYVLREQQDFFEDELKFVRKLLGSGQAHGNLCRDWRRGTDYSRCALTLRALSSLRGCHS